MKLFIPTNLDLEKHLIENPPNEVKHFKKDHLIYIINLISEIPANMERFDSFNGYVPINARTLKSKINNYRQYIKYLLRTEILETDNQYIVGLKSKGYRFTDKYREKLKDEEIITYSFIRRIKKDRDMPEEVNKKYSYLAKWFNEDFRVDKTAYDLLDSKHDSSTWDFKEMNKYFSAFRNIHRIEDHDFYVSVDSTVGRFHSNLTNLPGDYRNFVSYNNQELVSIDLINSQPYLITLLFKDDFYNESSLINMNKLTIYNSTSTLPSTPFPSFPPPMVVKILQYADNVDVEHFRQLVYDGLIYEYISREIFDQYQVKLDRGESKKVLFSVIYSGNQFIGQAKAKYKRLFRDRFPNTYKILCLIKSIDKNLLACIMQRIESYIILEIICKRIEMERPNLPIFTIHDSIITTSGNEDHIKYIMNDEFNRLIGHVPGLKVEYWALKRKL